MSMTGSRHNDCYMPGRTLQRSPSGGLVLVQCISPCGSSSSYSGPSMNGLSDCSDRLPSQVSNVVANVAEAWQRLAGERPHR